MKWRSERPAATLETVGVHSVPCFPPVPNRPEAASPNGCRGLQVSACRAAHQSTGAGQLPSRPCLGSARYWSAVLVCVRTSRVARSGKLPWERPWPAPAVIAESMCRPSVSQWAARVRHPVGCLPSREKLPIRPPEPDVRSSSPATVGSIGASAGRAVVAARRTVSSATRLWRHPPWRGRRAGPCQAAGISVVADDQLKNRPGAHDSRRARRQVTSLDKTSVTPAGPVVHAPERQALPVWAGGAMVPRAAR